MEALTKEWGEEDMGAGYGRRGVRMLRRMKGSDRIVMLTAYDAITASICEEAGVDVILVGDSVANTYLGHEDTLSVTVDEMVTFVRAVRRGAPNTPIVADMPFMSYEPSTRDALINAHKLILAGADGVKLEGVWPEQISALISAGIPVMGHIGLNPQRGLLSGYRTYGRSDQEARELISQALELERLGVFALIVEMVRPEVAEEIANRVSVPVIGIGSGPNLDGQVRVITDLLGLSKWSPSFAERYLEGRELFRQAISRFISDVKGR